MSVKDIITSYIDSLTAKAEVLKEKTDAIVPTANVAPPVATEPVVPESVVPEPVVPQEVANTVAPAEVVVAPVPVATEVPVVTPVPDPVVETKPGPVQEVINSIDDIVDSIHVESMDFIDKLKKRIEENKKAIGEDKPVDVRDFIDPTKLS